MQMQMTGTHFVSCHDCTYNPETFLPGAAKHAHPSPHMSDGEWSSSTAEGRKRHTELVMAALLSREAPARCRKIFISGFGLPMSFHSAVQMGGGERNVNAAEGERREAEALMAALATLEALSRALSRLPPALAAELQADLAKLIMQHSFIQARQHPAKSLLGECALHRAGLLQRTCSLLICKTLLIV